MQEQSCRDASDSALLIAVEFLTASREPDEKSHSEAMARAALAGNARELLKKQLIPR
jgi:hypothetical protein